jgi:hypothetical protein
LEIAMTVSFFRQSRPSWATLVVFGAVLCSSQAFAADKAQASEAMARYQRERAVCLNGESNQARAVCLREAGAALAEDRRGGLDDGERQYVRNATMRCERLPAPDRHDCMSRMQGMGTTTGNAPSGGIYRELVTREIVDPNQPARDPDRKTTPL